MPVSPVSLAHIDATLHSAPRRTVRKDPASAIYVADDWPDDLPILATELRAVEAWFGDILNDLWGPIP